MNFKEYFLSENIDTKIPILIKQFGKDPIFRGVPTSDIPNMIQGICNESDPTPSGEYITWILRMLRNKSIRMHEDFAKVKERLTQFHKLKKTSRFTAPKDINQYKNFADLAQTCDEFDGVVSKGEEVRANEVQGVKFIRESGRFKLWVVTTPEAASKLFKHTDWCVKDPKYFNQYAKQDPLYYYIEENGKPAYLAHFGSNQLRNIHDDTVYGGNGEDEDDSIKHIHALLSPLPAYIKLKNFITEQIKDEKNYEPPDSVGNYVYNWLSNIVEEPEMYFSWEQACHILQNPQEAITELRGKIDLDAGFDAARDSACDMEDDIVSSEFSSILAIDDIKVELHGENWVEQPSDFADAVIDRIKSLDDKDWTPHATRLIEVLKTKTKEDFKLSNDES